jgi:hypothetical protein
MDWRWGAVEAGVVELTAMVGDKVELGWYIMWLEGAGMKVKTKEGR